MIRTLLPIWIVCFSVSSSIVIKDNRFCLYCFTILLYIISSLLDTRFLMFHMLMFPQNLLITLLYLISLFLSIMHLLAPYAHVSIEWSDCILLPLLALNAVLLTFSKSISSFSLLSLCCYFNININVNININILFFRKSL